MGRLLLLFVALPAAELALLIGLGRRIGTGATLALILVTGVVGAALARQQGLGVLRELQAESAAGRLPAATLLDAALILVAAALLVTPGVLTDAFGFACLVPAFRRALRGAVLRRMQRAAEEGRLRVTVVGDAAWPGEPRVEKEVRDVRDAKPVRDQRDADGGPGA